MSWREFFGGGEFWLFPFPGICNFLSESCWFVGKTRFMPDWLEYFVSVLRKSSFVFSSCCDDGNSWLADFFPFPFDLLGEFCDEKWAFRGVFLDPYFWLKSNGLFLLYLSAFVLLHCRTRHNSDVLHLNYYYSEWIYEVIDSPKMPTKNFSDFNATLKSAFRAEILRSFGWHFGRNNDIIDSFWI